MLKTSISNISRIVENRKHGYHQLDFWEDGSRYAGVEKTPLDNDPNLEYKINIK